MREHVNGKEESYRSLPPAVPLAITPTSRRWTHTADDSYFYQLSLVVAAATVSCLLFEACTWRSCSMPYLSTLLCHARWVVL